MNRNIYLLVGALLLTSIQLFGQNVTIKGRVTDSNSGDPIPFANVVFNNSSVGATTDFDGFYTISTSNFTDSLVASYIGYKRKSKIYLKSISTINFQLEEDVISLQEVVFIAGENPAFEVLRNVVKNKPNNDKRKLTAYEYETYTKVEVDVDNINEDFRKKRIMKKIIQVMDSVDQIAGEDGKPILPLFISESISNFYYRNDPKLKHERILKTKISGVGVEDGSLVSQFIGSSFQEYNFYNNWLNIVGKEFVSPIADSWKLYYDYDLTDSLYIGDDYSYRLDFFPRSEQDLAFSGTIWITKKEYALKQIDVTVGKKANLNFIEKIKIQQELAITEQGPWIPVKNRVLIDVGEITKKSAGMLAKFYTSNKNIKVNDIKDRKFYEQPIILAEDYKLKNDESYWKQYRHEPLSSLELSVRNMIDTLKSIPVVKTYTEIIRIAVNGYKKVGKLDLGPYLSFYSKNTVEGHRFQLGFKTNIDFSNRWIVGARVAYGTKDEKFKYRLSGRYIASRKKWTEITASYIRDIDQVGLSENDLIGNAVFSTATRFGTLIKPYFYTETKIGVQRQLFKGFRQSVIFDKRAYEPIDGYFDFAYHIDSDDVTSPLAVDFTSSEVILESRFAKDEVFVQNDNDRLSLGTSKWPIFTIRYTHGFKGLAGGDFDYDKLSLNIRKSLKMGFFGTSKFSLTGQYNFSVLPYPLLKVHIGNESIFYTTAAFNLMKFSEFVSDRYVSFKYDHHFEGFLLNRIPLMKKLKWRTLATANVLYGGLRQENRDIIPDTDISGNNIEEPGFFETGTPYVELGYGIENIFKVLRIEAIHRINYLADRPDVDNFGIKVSFQFIL
jgi:hypothetical protein